MLSTVFFLLLFSNGINKHQPKIDISSFCLKSKQVRSKLDHALIEYDDMTASIYYKITYSPKQLHINKDAYQVTNRIVQNKDTVRIIQSYLMEFYVDKSEKIELKRTKTEGPITGEYSTIKITLYYKDGKTEVFSDTIGSQEYIIEYNPKYESFLKFLEIL